MRTLRYAAHKNVLLTKTQLGTVQIQRAAWPVLSYATQRSRSIPKPIKSRKILFASVGGALGIGALATAEDDFKHGTFFRQLYHKPTRFHVRN